ncbi:hypothetical protein HYS54_01145, partial [Candidatus Micrarchaeota archaeon]|nr:hypothetical protein [Candidatus Micrarchaeota archaeon]
MFPNPADIERMRAYSQWKQSGSTIVRHDNGTQQPRYYDTLLLKNGIASLGQQESNTARLTLDTTKVPDPFSLRGTYFSDTSGTPGALYFNKNTTPEITDKNGKLSLDKLALSSSLALAKLDTQTTKTLDEYRLYLETQPEQEQPPTKTNRSPYANYPDQNHERYPHATYPDQATTPAGTNTNPDFIYMNGTFIPTVNGPGGRYPITAKPAELAQLYQDGQIPKKAFDNAMASKFQAREYALSVYARESMGGSYTSSILQDNYLMNEIDTPQVQYEYALAVSSGDKGAQAHLKSVIDGNPASVFFHTLGNIDLGLFSTTYRLGYELAADPTPTRAVVLGIAVAPVPKPVNTLISRIFTGTKNLFGAAKGTLGSLLERAPGRTYMTKLFHTPTTREQLTSTRSVIRPITTAVTETIPKTWTPNEQNVIRQPGEIIGKSAVKESPGFRGHLEEVRQGGLTRFEEVGKRTGWT